MATLTTEPPALALSMDRIPVEVTTEATIYTLANFILTISSTGPTAGQTLRIQWAGEDITFTVSATDTDSPLELPVIGAFTLAQYVAAFAECLRENYTLHQAFIIAHNATQVLCTARVREVLDITITETLSNVSVVVTDLAAIADVDNPHAVIQVFEDSGDAGTDDLIVTLHAPYNLNTAKCEVDIQSAFSDLEPFLVPNNTIPDIIPPFTAVSALKWGIVTAGWRKYYLRTADAGGYPTSIEALARTVDSYICLLGAHAGNALVPGTVNRRCHDFTRSDGQTFWKPVGMRQPDYLFWLSNYASGTEAAVDVYLYWSDGSESVYEPFTGDTYATDEDQMYYFGTGYYQLALQNAPVPPGADADAYIVRYVFRFGQGLGSLGNALVAGYYELLLETQEWGHHLYFHNGVGGCETVWLRGKSEISYDTDGDQYRRQRVTGDTAREGDFEKTNSTGRMKLSTNSGHFTDATYLEHIRQMAMGPAWLIDIRNRRFQKCIVTPGSISKYYQDDRELHSCNFSIEAGWIDQAANL